MMSQKWGMRDGFDSTHNGVFGLPGKKGRLIIYCGDRWSELHGIGTGRQVWLPIEIEDGRPGISWLRPWFADVEAGEFSHQLREYGLWR